jgi:Zn-dependent protease with chaperone function
MGFIGRVEYRHLYSQTGGAQYCQGSTVAEDLLTVYAEAFERDSNLDDFSLEAIIAHERGHQLLARHARLAKRVQGVSIGTEEILASLLGAMLCLNDADRDSLMAKATVELIHHGEAVDIAIRRLQELWKLLETLL